MVCCGCDLLLVIVSFDDVGMVVFLALRSVVLTPCLGCDSDMLLLGWLLKDLLIAVLFGLSWLVGFWILWHYDPCLPHL